MIGINQLRLLSAQPRVAQLYRKAPILTRTLFAPIYIISALFYSLTQYEMCGGGLNVVARSLLGLIGVSTVVPGWHPYMLGTILSPFGLIITAYLRSRASGPKTIVAVSVAALLAAWVQPVGLWFLAMLPGFRDAHEHVNHVYSTFIEILAGLDVALLPALVGAGLALDLRSGSARHVASP